MPASQSQWFLLHFLRKGERMRKRHRIWVRNNGTHFNNYKPCLGPLRQITEYLQTQEVPTIGVIFPTMQGLLAHHLDTTVALESRREKETNPPTNYSDWALQGLSRRPCQNEILCDNFRLGTRNLTFGVAGSPCKRFLLCHRRRTTDSALAKGRGICNGGTADGNRWDLEFKIQRVPAPSIQFV